MDQRPGIVDEQGFDRRSAIEFYRTSAAQARLVSFELSYCETSCDEAPVEFPRCTPQGSHAYAAVFAIVILSARNGSGYGRSAEPRLP